MTAGPAAGPRTVAWFHCFAGAAGDMVLGSLLDAGADLDEVVALLRRVPLDGWSLRTEEVLRGGVACTRAVVTAADAAPARTHAHLARLVREAVLPDRVASRALAVFGALARAEAAVHRTDPAGVHFHEVGGHDAVVDVVGTAAALEVLGVDGVAASPVAVGLGTVTAAHGVLPNPPPAVVRLLEGVPAYGRPVPVELTTPTGAALLAALATSFGPMPAMEVRASGFGAGTAELEDLPNCTQVVVGRASAAAAGDAGGQPVVQLEANLDDVTGEQLALAVAALLEAGAHDAWVTPTVMKKGRPAHTVHALCDPALAARLREVLRSTTGTLGVRALEGRRWPSPRRMGTVEVAGEPIRMKAGPHRAKPELDDVARASARTGLPAHEVASRAEEAWRRATNAAAAGEPG
ncbi:MAG: nickel pincer cofactor biosynthesis protein LarC [Acidimicrobiales bacterium]